MKKIENRKMLDEIIDNIPAFKMYERGYKCRIVVTGSFLLHMNGLADGFDDIDILIVDAPQLFWQELFSNDYRWEIKDYGEYKSVKVKRNRFVYNLIQDNEYCEIGNGFIDCNGEIEMDTLSNALKAKANLNRPKDHIYFKSLIEQISAYLPNPESGKINPQ